MNELKNDFNELHLNDSEQDIDVQMLEKLNNLRIKKPIKKKDFQCKIPRSLGLLKIIQKEAASKLSQDDYFSQHLNQFKVIEFVEEVGKIDDYLVKRLQQAPCINQHQLCLAVVPYHESIYLKYNQNHKFKEDSYQPTMKIHKSMNLKSENEPHHEEEEDEEIHDNILQILQ